MGLRGPKPKDTLQRFVALVQPVTESGCWLWLGTVVRKGHGTFYVNSENRKLRAHRVAYELFKGPIPEGLHVLHRCDVPCCVNPAHLFLGTHDQNMADMKRKGRARKGKGEQAATHKLTSAQVLEIRASDDSNAALGRRLGISTSHIRLIRARQFWQHI